MQEPVNIWNLPLGSLLVYQLIQTQPIMSASTLTKLILPVTLLSGAVFSSLTLPLVLFAAKPIDIRVNQEPIFVGDVRDIAAPYVGLAALVSFGAGVAGIAIAGWRQSSRQSERMAEKLVGVQQQLQARESQLEEALLAEPRLAAAGLDKFLPDHPVVPATVPQVLPQPVRVEPPASPTRVQAKLQAKYLVHDRDTHPPDRAVPTPTTAQAVVPLAAAQAFLSFTRAAVPNPAQPEITAETSAEGVHIQELQEQIQLLLQRMETLQAALNVEPVKKPTLAQTKQSAVSLEYHPHYQTIESHWSMQKVAS